VNELHDLADTPTEALDQILELVVLLNEDATRSLARDGLTLPRAGVVWFLHHNGPSTQRAIADFLKVTPRNVTGLVDALVETGFVTREPHPSDRRATLVSLTDHGAAVLARMDRSHKELAAQLFGAMSEREFRVFAKGLAHVLGVVREGTR
jgi:DNA-binding MarR family transcriptional regulator